MGGSDQLGRVSSGPEEGYREKLVIAPQTQGMFRKVLMDGGGVSTTKNYRGASTLIKKGDKVTNSYMGDTSGTLRLGG